MSTGTVVSLLIATGFLAVLGILIKYFGMANLIAGYDPEIVTDEEGLADFIGTNTLMLLGLQVPLLPWSTYSRSKDTGRSGSSIFSGLDC